MELHKEDSSLSSHILTSFVPSVIDHPEVFVESSESVSQQILDVTKILYDYAKEHESSFSLKTSPLQKLLVDGFDIDQIWEQIQLQNEPILRYLEKNVNHFPEDVDLDFSVLEPKRKKQKINNGENQIDSLSDDMDKVKPIKKLTEKVVEKKNLEKKKRDQEIDENMFFSYEDMERFVEQAENEAAGFIQDYSDEEDEERAMAYLYGELKDEDLQDEEEVEEEGEDSGVDIEDLGVDDDESEGEDEGEGLEGIPEGEKEDNIDKHLDSVIDKLVQEEDFDKEDPDPSQPPVEKKDHPQNQKQKKKKKKTVNPRFAKYEHWFAPAGQTRVLHNRPDDVEANLDKELHAYMGYSNAPGENDQGDGMNGVDGADGTNGVRLEDPEDAENPDGMEDPEGTEDSDREGDPDGADGADGGPNDADDPDRFLSKFEREEKLKRKEIMEGEKLLMEQENKDDLEELSIHQKKQLRMQQKIKKLEEENLKTKEWKFAGETQSKNRPINSLLSEEIEYDYGAKLAPVITDEITQSLEEIIKYRISENAFDDVIKKNLFDEQKKWKERVELDSSKSKKSLATIYEEEYQQTVAGVSSQDPSREEKYREIERLFRKVCVRFDALSHVNYTLKKKKEREAEKVVENLAEAEKNKNSDIPAIHMEEVIPITVSKASLLAPEEIFEKPDKVTLGETEKTKEDRKKERKEKKETKRKKNKTKASLKLQKERAKGVNTSSSHKTDEEELKKQSIDKAVQQIKESGEKNVKFVTGTDTTNYSKSSALFQKLQEDAKKQANTFKKGASEQEKPTKKRDNSANKYKL